MRKSTRIIASGLALSMMVPMITSCKKGRGGETVASDAPWYTMTSTVIEDGLDAENVDYGYSLYIGMHNDTFVFKKGGSYKLPSDFDYDRDDISDYAFQSVDAYDINGNLVQSVDLSGISSQFPQYDYALVNSVGASGDGYEAIIECVNYTTGQSAYYTVYVDMDTGTCSDPVSVEDNGLISSLVADGGMDEGTISVGDYDITKVWFSGDITSYDLVVTDPNGNSGEADLRAADPMTALYNIQGIIDIGNNKGLVIGAVSGGEAAFYELDLTTLNITKINEDMTWLSSKINDIRSVDGLGTVICDKNGVYAINYDNRSIDPLFLYEYANVNAFVIGTFTPIMITEDRAIFSGVEYNPYPVADQHNNTVLYIFDRADSNPNSGKTILDVAAIDSVTYPLAAAVCSFNETNPDYYLRLDTSYQIPNSVLWSTDDNADQQLEDATNNLGNQLAIDIMSGTGPDIIINGSEFGMLNNDDYLIDLSDFAATNCSSDGYFTNVMEVSKNNGQLFQIPLSFGIQGIAAPASSVDEGQTGFTYEEYTAFVAGPCNGNNPINKGRMYFFINSLNTMTDLMITDSTANYDNEAFRTLAEYTAANINEVLQSDDGEDYYYMDENAAFMSNISSINYYIGGVVGSGKVLLGVPSFDGRGPAITSRASVGISAQTIAPDACKEFVSLLLGDQIQEYYGAQEGIPVNRSAFMTVGQMCVQMHNDEVNDALSRYSESEARSYGISVDLFDDEVLNDLESLINTLDCAYVNDSSVNAIIREEVPSFFEGQKTLEQIIPVLNDRIQTVINERR